jgi:hypothetical protein
MPLRSIISNPGLGGLSEGFDLEEICAPGWAGGYQMISRPSVR